MDTTILIPARIKTIQDIEWLKVSVSSAVGQGKIVIAYNNCNPDLELPKFAKKAAIHTIEAKNLAGVRNWLVTQVKTPYFLFLDADDLLTPNSVEAMETFIKTVPEKRYIYSGTLIFGEGELEVLARDFNCQALTKGVYFTNGVLQPIQNMKIVGNWDENLDVLEDKEWWIRAAEHEVIGAPLKDIITYKYRQHGNSMVAVARNTDLYHDALTYIAKAHKKFYEGDFPMCCGSKVTPVPANLSVTPNNPLSGQIQVRYMLGTASIAYFGVVTGTRYVVSSTKPLINIDVRDASTGTPRRPGLLELTKNNKPVFVQV